MSCFHANNTAEPGALFCDSLLLIWVSVGRGALESECETENERTKEREREKEVSLIIKTDVTEGR